MKGFFAIFLIVRRSLRQHALSTGITALSVALGCGLLMTIFSVRTQTYNAFTQGGNDFDAVLGPRGSKLQLVLNSVFHLETSQGTVKWSLYQLLKKHAYVEEAIPFMVGDNYRRHKVVATVPQYLTEHEITEGQTFQFREGEIFAEDRADAVVGSFAAQKTGLKVGDVFYTNHGDSTTDDSKHDLPITVVGILEPTNTPADNVIWVPLEVYFRMPGHDLMGTGVPYRPRPGEPIPEKHKEVSAVMLKFKDKLAFRAGQEFDQIFNKTRKDTTLAAPVAKTIADLFEKIGWAQRVLTLVAYLVILVAAGSILASIYNTMNERRREFAILRALGARKAIVFGAIVAEAGAIAAIGAAVAFAFYTALMVGIAMVMRGQTGVVLDPLAWHPVLWIGPLAVIGLGMLAGTVPALKAYTTDVASNLTPST